MPLTFQHGNVQNGILLSLSMCSLRSDFYLPVISTVVYSCFLWFQTWCNLKRKKMGTMHFLKNGNSFGFEIWSLSWFSFFAGLLAGLGGHLWWGSQAVSVFLSWASFERVLHVHGSVCSQGPGTRYACMTRSLTFLHVHPFFKRYSSCLHINCNVNIL